MVVLPTSVIVFADAKSEVDPQVEVEVGSQVEVEGL